MDRRDLLYNLALMGAGASQLHRVNLLFGESQSSGMAADVARARPTAQQRAWQDLEVGMFVHFAPNTWQDREYDNLSTPLTEINPAGLDTDQWVETALALGARYIVFVAKHQGGFCMWQTRTTDYGIRNTPWKGGKGDVLAEIAASCRKRDLPLGVYVSPRDDHFGTGQGGACKTPELQRRYNAMYREQLTEVFSRYGKLEEIWFDGSIVVPVGDLIQRYQPDAMVFQGPEATIRWVGSEEGSAPYPCWNGIDAAEARTGVATALDSDPNGSVWMPVEVDVSIRRPDWFWHTNNANKVLSVDQLMSIYYRSVGRGAQLLLNIPANRAGLLPEPDCATAAKFGREVQRRFGHALAATHGSGSLLMLRLERPSRIDTVVLQEALAQGERVRAYTIEGQVEGAWRPLAEGTAIGRKRIQPVSPAVVSAVRLSVTRSAGEPAIRSFAVFDTGVAPPADWNAATHLWAPNLVGRWSGGAFSLDLGGHIDAAAQYALQFKAQEGGVRDFRNVVLEIGGTPAPAAVKQSPTRADELLLDITGVDRSIHISGKVEGAESGSILLERR
ncbi:MAG TPA: alpha-L-fucosidase [Acidobacteriaceae bacterium]|nr:alpha-L-fucosidase [Acidobacteriaceae bacterium]